MDRPDSPHVEAGPPPLSASGTTTGRELYRVIAVGWCAYAVYRIVQTLLLGAIATPGVLNAADRIVLSITDGVLMMAMTPVAVWAARRFPVSRRSLENAFVHLGVGVICSGMTLEVLRVVGHWLTGIPLAAPFSEALLGWTTTCLFAYSIIVAVTHTFDAQSRARQSHVRAAALEGMLSSAKLETLRAQLQPHFLFNTLNAIAELVHVDPDMADEMLQRLSKLLRRSLETSQLRDVSLIEEIDHAALFLDIHRIRLGARLAVEYRIEPALESFRVPPLIIQPLVENAIIHGIERADSDVRIVIAAQRVNGQVRIAISDNGAGIREGTREGIGLANTRRRLAEHFGTGQSLELKNGVPRGAVSTLTISVRES